MSELRIQIGWQKWAYQNMYHADKQKQHSQKIISYGVAYIKSGPSQCFPNYPKKEKGLGKVSDKRQNKDYCQDLIIIVRKQEPWFPPS